MSPDRNPVRPPEIGGIRAPDSPLCLAATEFAQRVCEPFLFNHVMRSYYFAELVASERAKSCDREVLYVSAVLHDLGLTSVAPVKARFEIEGADAAVDFLSKRGMSDKSLAIVWEAIALHTTPEIPLRRCAEVAMCQLGIAVELGLVPMSVAASGVADEILEAYPRRNIGESLIATLVGLYEKNPASAASHAVADACALRVPGFRRPNVCELIARLD